MYPSRPNGHTVWPKGQALGQYWRRAKCHVDSKYLQQPSLSKNSHCVVCWWNCRILFENPPDSGPAFGFSNVVHGISRGAFSHSARTAPIISLCIPGAPLKTTHLQERT